LATRRIPRAAHWSSTPIAVVLRPMQDFMRSASAGGIVLFVAAFLALALTNSPLAGAFEHLLHTEIGIEIGGYGLHHSFQHWVNDGLMAIFFLLVGLEIKREIIAGELSHVRAAMLPIFAAAGGVIVPALIYSLVNSGGPGAAGWGIPTATDIAFALACLTVLGSRVPFPLKIFVTAVAIVDDLIAVVVIALFYSSNLNLVALGAGFAILLVLLAANLFGIRSLPFYLTLGVVVWLAFLQSGVHATIAGVLLALTIPARYRINDVTFLERARGILAQFEESQCAPTPMLTDERQQSAVIALESACEQVQAPLQKLEHDLQTPVMFLIMPLFALANAGVTLSLEGSGGGGMLVTVGIVLGLVLGKPIGLIGASWLACRAGLASLPTGVTWRQMSGAGVLAGIGFTMSLLIATLGLGQGPLLDSAKLGILLGSAIAGSAGIFLLSRAGAPEQRPSDLTPVPVTAASATHRHAAAEGAADQRPL
jgi:Na+:H+ antiporter, NhaA family